MATREERNAAALRTLHPQCAVRVKLLIANAALKGMQLLIVQAKRTFADQQALYLGGAQAAPPGHSFHEFGLAADLVDIAKGNIHDRYDPEDWKATDYDWIANEAEALGLVAGHHWIHRDSPHVEYHPGYTPREASKLKPLADHSGNLSEDFFA